jgi:hypothetical protein
METWRCRHCENINRNEVVACEVCDNRRPVIKELIYRLSDAYGKIEVIWDIEDVNTIVVKKGKSIYHSTKDCCGHLELSGIKNKDVITIELTNIYTTYTTTIEVLFSKPEIISFSSNKTSVVVGEKLILEWNVLNAKTVSIPVIGMVEGGIGKRTVEATKDLEIIRLVAQNTLGSVEQEMKLKILTHQEKKDIDLCEDITREADKLFAKGKWKEAETQYKNALVLCLHKEELLHHIEQCTKKLEVTYNDMLHKATIAEEKENFKEAIAYLQRALAVKPDVEVEKRIKIDKFKNKFKSS